MFADAIQGVTSKLNRDSLAELRIRLSFGADQRIDFYDAFETLFSNGIGIREALLKLYQIYSRDGKKPNNPTAIVAQSCLTAVSQGKGLAAGLARYVNEAEVSMIEAGEKHGGLAEALIWAGKIAKGKSRIMSAIIGNSVYPAALFGMAFFMLHIISTKMIPSLARMVKPENWEGAAKLLYVVSTFSNKYGIYTVVLLLAGFAAILGSMPHIRGSIRVKLDRLPPWSIYKAIYGSIFILNIAALLKGEIGIKESLQLLAKSANPWLKERLEAAIYGTSMGQNLGEALSNAEFEFPDERAIQYISILSGKDGSEDKLASFGERWLEKTIARVERASKVLFYLALGLIGVLMVVVLLGVMQIQNLVQAGFH